MDFPTLETERLQLIQIGNDHKQSYFDIMSMDKVTKYYGMDRLKSVEEAAKIMDSFRTSFENKRAIRWGIQLKKSGEFIGTVGLNQLNIAGKKAEVGYELHPAFWRMGITTEAVREVLRYSFEEIGLFRLAAVTYPQNEASILVLKKLGFQKEGVLRGYLYQNNQSHDAFVFSVLRTEWQN